MAIAAPRMQWMFLVALVALPTAPLPSEGAENAMFNPAIDTQAEEWCYAAKSTTVIGMPFVPEPVQVTYDGAIYTRYAELAFFYGEKLHPIMARNKTFLDGWIPVVEYRWKYSGIDYHLEIFSAELRGLGTENLIQFAKLAMSNCGESTAEGVIAAATRSSAEHFRKGNVKKRVNPATRFAMDDDCVTRDGALIYCFSSGAEKCAVPEAPYQGAYTAMDHGITDRAATGFSIYRRQLRPGETFSAVFKMPRKPLADPKQVAAIRAADYQSNRDMTVQYWRKLFGQCQFYVPEKRVNNSFRAALVHLILATRDQGRGKRQGSGLPYDRLFLNDYMDMLLAYELYGLDDLARPNVDWLISKQHKSGMFIDVHNRGNDDIVTSHGQGLFALAYPFIVTRDMAYAKKVYPYVRKGVEFIIRDHRTHNPHGLLRPSIPYDAPMLTGFHTCHNLFALTALRASIRMARMLGETGDVKNWTEAHDTYKEAILKAINDTYKKEGYIRSGLYDWAAGWVQGRVGRVNAFPNQDWENNLLIYPTELLEPKDPRVTDTLATIRARKYREGCMTYRNGMHIHQYITLNQAQQYLAIGNQKHALLDLYHVLLHNGSTHEGFENLVEPWTNRTPREGCPPPHAWAAAKTALFLRNLMVREYGGDMGMDMKSRDLHLYSLISPSWIKPSQQLRICNAPTEMGNVSSTLAFTQEGAELNVKADFHSPPRYLAVRIPYFVKLESFTTDAGESVLRDGIIYFSPDVATASLKWTEIPGVHRSNYQEILKGYRSEFGFIVTDGNYDPKRAGKPFLLEDEKDHPAEPMSFDLVRKAFLKEYTRRFNQYVAEGGKPYPVEPPPLMTREQRRAAFGRRFKPIGKTSPPDGDLPNTHEAGR